MKVTLGILAISAGAFISWVFGIGSLLFAQITSDENNNLVTALIALAGVLASCAGVIVGWMLKEFWPAIKTALKIAKTTEDANRELAEKAETVKELKAELRIKNDEIAKRDREHDREVHRIANGNRDSIYEIKREHESLKRELENLKAKLEK